MLSPMEALVSHPREGGRKEGGGQFLGLGTCWMDDLESALGEGGDGRICPGNISEVLVPEVLQKLDLLCMVPVDLKSHHVLLAAEACDRGCDLVSRV